MVSYGNDNGSTMESSVDELLRAMFIQEAQRMDLDKEREAQINARADLHATEKELLRILQDEQVYYYRYGKLSPYKYVGLAATRREIRLLTLLPGQWLERLNVELSIVSLDDNPKYEALSYTWGNDEFKEPLHVSNKPVGITTNLKKALRRLRSPIEALVIWVDAVCINQENMDERAQQVMMMGDIYSQCQRVIIWLGDDQPLSGPHIDLGGKGNSKNYPMYDPWILCRELARDIHLHECVGFMASERDVQEGEVPSAMITTLEWQPMMDAVLDSPWWDRIWVVQETLLPSKALLCYGTDSVEWTVVATAIQNVRRHLATCCARPWGIDDFHMTINSLIEKISAIEAMRAQLQADQKPSLLQLLHAFRTREANDVRDKIYGLLGLQPSFESVPLVTPNYTTPAGQVFRQVAIDIVRDSRTLDLLIGHNVWDLAPESVGPTSHDWLAPQELSTCDDLPSWAPDWSISQNLQSAEILRSNLARSTFHASGDFASVEIEVTDNMLDVPGLRVDTVYEVSRVPFPVETLTTLPSSFTVAAETAITEWALVFERVFDMSDNPYKHLHGGAGPAFLRTVLGGHILESTVEPNVQDARAIQLEDLVDLQLWMLEDLKTLSDSAPKAGERDATDFLALTSWTARNHKLLQTVWNSPIGISVKVAAMRRTFFTTQKGYIGLGPANIRPMDQIFILDGAKTPFILRCPEKELHDWLQAQSAAGQLISSSTIQRFFDSYSFVGDCYVDGVMDGEYANAHQAEKRGVKIV